VVALNAPLPPLPALNRPAQRLGSVLAGLEGYDMSKPWAPAYQQNDKAYQTAVKYSADKLPLWTKAFYGGTVVYPATYAATIFDAFGPASNSRHVTGGLAFRPDMGRCSLQGAAAGIGDMSTCSGKRGEGYAAILMPDVFIGWEQTSPLAYTFTVRKGVMWPNIPPMARADREVTAPELVDFYVEQKKRGSIKDTLVLIDKIEAVDKYTIRMTLTTPQADFLRVLANRALTVVPRECFDKTACADKNILISPGPFIITEVVLRERIVLVKNQEWHLKGAPWADRIEALLSLTDGATQKAAFVTGKIDHYNTTVLSEAEAIMKQVPGAQNHAFSAGTGVVHYRVRLQGPLADVRVRRALARAVDFPALWQLTSEGNVYGGGLISYEFLGRGVPISAADMGENYKYDPATAKRLLTEAGYPDGFALEVMTSSTSGGTYDINVVLQDYWKRNLNVEVKILIIPSGSNPLRSKTWNGLIQQGSVGPGGATLDIDTTLLQFVKGAANNLQEMDDPVLTDLYRQQQGELDPVKRRAMLWQFEQRVHDQVWWMFFGSNLTNWMQQPWEMNAVSHLYGFSNGLNAASWTYMIDPSKGFKR
jgi:peptide/nickel transport system substrate-binding protein